MLSETHKQRVKLLITAIRSGEWERRRGALGDANTNKRCCLGVGCEVAITNGLSVSIEEVDNLLSYDGEQALLPESVSGWFGFDDFNPLLKFGDQWITASDTNDNHLFGDGGKLEYIYTWDQIADAFERTYIYDEIDNYHRDILEEV